MAFLNKGLRIDLTDERAADRHDSFCYERGLMDYVGVSQLSKKN